MWMRNGLLRKVYGNAYIAGRIPDINSSTQIVRICRPASVNESVFKDFSLVMPGNKRFLSSEREGLKRQSKPVTPPRKSPKHRKAAASIRAIQRATATAPVIIPSSMKPHPQVYKAVRDFEQLLVESSEATPDSLFREKSTMNFLTLRSKFVDYRALVVKAYAKLAKANKNGEQSDPTNNVTRWSSFADVKMTPSDAKVVRDIVAIIDHFQHYFFSEILKSQMSDIDYFGKEMRDFHEAMEFLERGLNQPSSTDQNDKQVVEEKGNLALVQDPDLKAYREWKKFENPKGNPKLNLVDNVTDFNRIREKYQRFRPHVPASKLWLNYQTLLRKVGLAEKREQALRKELSRDKDLAADLKSLENSATEMTAPYIKRIQLMLEKGAEMKSDATKLAFKQAQQQQQQAESDQSTKPSPSV